MAACINPECRNGFVPGIGTSGYGTHDGARPIIDGSGRNTAKMQWKPVPCPACRPQPKGPGYVPIARSEDEIAERWDLASKRAPYNDKSKSPAAPANGAAGAPKSGTPTAPAAIDPTVAERIATALERLTARIEVLTGAVLELIEVQSHPLVETRADLNPASLETVEIDIREPPDGVSLRSAAHPTKDDMIIGLLQQLLDSAKIASHPPGQKSRCAETTAGAEPKRVLSRSSPAKTKGGSARKRGGTVGASTEK